MWRVRAPRELQLHTPPDLQMMTILEGNDLIIHYLISSWNTAHSAALAGDTAPVLGPAEQQARLASLSDTYEQQQVTSWCGANGALARRSGVRGQTPAAFLSLQDLTSLSIKDQWFGPVRIVAPMQLTPEALGRAARSS